MSIMSSREGGKKHYPLRSRRDGEGTLHCRASFSRISRQVYIIPQALLHPIPFSFGKGSEAIFYQSSMRSAPGLLVEAHFNPPREIPGARTRIPHYSSQIPARLWDGCNITPYAIA
jgi:hypothetical protein